MQGLLHHSLLSPSTIRSGSWLPWRCLYNDSPRDRSRLGIEPCASLEKHHGPQPYAIHGGSVAGARLLGITGERILGEQYFLGIHLNRWKTRIRARTRGCSTLEVVFKDLQQGKDQDLNRIISGGIPLLLAVFRRRGRRGWRLGRCGPLVPFLDVLLDDVRFTTRLRRAGHRLRSNTCSSLPGYGQRVSQLGQPSMVHQLSP